MINLKNVIAFDANTGEKMEGLPVWVSKKNNPYGKGWIMNSQEALEELAEDKELTGETLRIFLLLSARLDFENWIQISQKEIAEKLGMKKQNVSRSMKILESKSIILKIEASGRSNAYRLNPHYGWKGKVRNLDDWREQQRTEESRQLSNNNNTKRLELVKQKDNEESEQIET